MKHKVIKRFYDPFLKRRVMPGEEIEIPEKYIKGYKPYIVETKEEAIKEPISNLTTEESTEEPTNDPTKEEAIEEPTNDPITEESTEEPTNNSTIEDASPMKVVEEKPKKATKK